MWAPTAGAMLEWFKGAFCENLDYRKIDELAESVPSGSEGLICVPHLCGTVMPENLPNAKGVFFGMELKHNRGHFLRAIMESVSYMIREFVDFMKVDVEEIRSMGGGAKSKIWCEIKASTLGKKVATLKENETACLGSAMFAGLGAGVYESLKSASDKIVAKNLTYSPVYPEYHELYENYKKKENKILEIF
jgi:xylulokinase